MNRRNRSMLSAVFEKPTRADVRYADVERLLLSVGCTFEQRAGSRVAFVAENGALVAFHKPHKAELKKYQVEAIRDFLIGQGIEPEDGA